MLKVRTLPFTSLLKSTMLGILIASVSLVAASAAIQNSIPSASGVYLGLPAEAGAVSTDSVNSVHTVQYFVYVEPPRPDLIPTPLQQVKDNVPADDVECDRRVLMTSPSGVPVCVLAGSVDVLKQRGFILPFEAPCGNHSVKQPRASEKTGVVSQDVLKIDGKAFVTTWQTTSPNESITIPVGNATGTYTVSWGDGSVSANVTGDQTHAYGEAGTYTVVITGDFEKIYLNNDSINAPKLQSIEQWGNISWASMDSAFNGASSMIYNATDIPDLSDVTDTSCMFAGAHYFNGDLSNWDVSGVTDMSGMFYSAGSFNGRLASWDVSGVTDMTSMFSGADSFNDNISPWDVSGVTDMSRMFRDASSFNGDLSPWDVSGVTNMSGMFHGARSFDTDLFGWDVSGVTDMSDMFHGASSFNSVISSWNVSGVTDMSGMLRGSSFNGDLSSWDVSGVTDMSGMLPSSSFNGDLSSWDVSGVTDMSGMFGGSKFIQR